MFAHKKRQKKNSRKDKAKNGQKVQKQVESAEIQRAIADPSNAKLTPQVMDALQRAYGNQFVQRLVDSRTDASSSMPIIQRLPDKATWVAQSTMTGALGGEYDRSAELVAIDNALDAYDKVKDSEDFKKRKFILGEIDTAIRLWRESKGKKKGDKEPAKDAKRWKYIDSLIAEMNKEKDKVQKDQIAHTTKLKQESAAAKNKILPEIVTSDIQVMEDPAAKAVAVFNSYMNYFRGTASYTLKTQQGTTIFNSGGTIACATISQGLVDAMKYADLDAKVIQIAEQNFITKQIDTGKFMDSSAVGNVFNASDPTNFGAVKRFFFTKHWIVEVTDAGVYFDPTSGIQVSSANANEIIDNNYKGFKDVGEHTYAQGDNLKLVYQGDIAPSGGGYKLVKPEED